jgi:hypothetical protein
VGFVADKVALGQVSPSTSVSPANLHSINCSTITIIYHLGRYNRPVAAAIPLGLSLSPIIIIIIIIIIIMKCVRWENIWKTEKGDKTEVGLHNVNCSEVAQWRIFY